MKALKLSVLGLIASGAAWAGTAVMEAPIEPMIEEPEAMGGSGAWILVLIGLGILAATMIDDSTE